MMVGSLGFDTECFIQASIINEVPFECALLILLGDQPLDIPSEYVQIGIDS